MLQLASGKATIHDGFCCNQWGPSHGGGDHGRWWCRNQFLFCYNLPSNPIFCYYSLRILLDTTLFFCYRRLDFATTGVCFCFHHIMFLLEPVFHVFGSTPVQVFCRNRCPIFFFFFHVVFVLLESVLVFASITFLVVSDAAVHFEAATSDEDGRLHRSCGRRHGE